MSRIRSSTRIAIETMHKKTFQADEVEEGKRLDSIVEELSRLEVV